MLLDPAIRKIIEDNVKAYFVLILLFVCAVRFFLVGRHLIFTESVTICPYTSTSSIYEDRTLVASDGSLPSTSDILNKALCLLTTKVVGCLLPVRAR